MGDDERQLRAWMWAGTSLAAVVLLTVSVPLAATLYGLDLTEAFVTGLALAGALPLAVRLPWSAVGLATGGMLAFALLSLASDGAPWPWPVTTIVGQSLLLIVLGVLRPWQVGFVAWGAGLVVTVPFAYVDAGSAANVVTALPVTALVLAVAVLVAQRRTVGAELFRARAHSAAEQERRVLVEERNRVARELHDVVAHGLSIIHVQATSAPYRVDGLSETARTEFREIAESARTAMTEMRQLLGVLRSDEATAETVPQPGLGDLPALVASVERAGVPVSLALGDHVGDPSDDRADRHADDRLPEGGLAANAAYRIVQEALSNVVRHAPGARTRVSVRVLDGALVVSVENDAATGVPTGVSAADEAGGGHGLVGIGERATLLGGRAQHGARPGGGYRVLATLPLGSPDGGTV